MDVSLLVLLILKVHFADNNFVFCTNSLEQFLNSFKIIKWPQN